MSTSTETIQDKAREAAHWFEQTKRDPSDDDSYYVRRKDDAPEWVTDLVYAAHHGWTDWLPDDYRYKWTWYALDAIAQADDPEDGASEFADGAVDVYTNRLNAWLGSNLNRVSYVDDAREEFFTGESGGSVTDDIMRGQYAEAYEVYGLVLTWITEAVQS